MFIESLKKAVDDEPNNDLFLIIYDGLNSNKFKFIDILYEASQGYGIISSEGCGYSLDKDYDQADDFNEVNFFLGEIETSKMSVSDFISYLCLISDKYISVNLNHKEKIEQYLNTIKFRYEKFL